MNSALALVLALSLAVSCVPIPEPDAEPIIGIPSDWQRLARDDWSIYVPPGWTPEPPLEYETPKRLVIRRPAHAGTAAPTSVAPGRGRPAAEMPVYGYTDPEVELTVWRWRDELDLQSATDVYARSACFSCPAQLRNERLQVELDHDPATLTKIMRGDRAAEWHLVTQSYCHTFVVRIVVAPGQVDELTGTVDRVLASLRIKADGSAWRDGC